LLLFYSTFRITSLLGHRDTGVATLLSVGVLSETLTGLFCYMYSYDLHGVVLLVCGLHLMYARPRWGSALVMLSLFVRPTYALLVPFVLCAWRGMPQRAAHPRDIMLGAGSVLCLYLLVNALMWGGPLVTAYHRVVAFGPDGEVFIEHHPQGLNLNVLLSDWGHKLFDSHVGLLPFNPVLIGFPWVCAWAWRCDHRWFALSTLTGSVLYGLYMFSYERWEASYVGNRFILPSVYLYLLSFIPWFSNLLESVRAAHAPRKLAGSSPAVPT